MEKYVGLFFLILVVSGVYFFIVRPVELSRRHDDSAFQEQYMRQSKACEEKGGALLTGSVVVIPLPAGYEFPCVKTLN